MEVGVRNWESGTGVRNHTEGSQEPAKARIGNGESGTQESGTKTGESGTTMTRASSGSRKRNVMQDTARQASKQARKASKQERQASE